MHKIQTILTQILWPKSRIKRIWIATLIISMSGVFLLRTPDRMATELITKYRLPESKFFTYKNIRLHYTDKGSGFPILMVHGLGSSLFTWNEFEKYLPANYRLVRLDIPGFGLSEFPLDGDVSAKAWAESIEALCSHLQITSFIGIGNSMGARALIEVALRDKVKPQALVLMNSAGLTHEKSSFPVLKLAQIPGLRFLVKHYAFKGLVARTLKHAYRPRTSPAEFTIERTYELLLFPGHRQAFINVANSPDRRLDPLRLKSLKIPVFYIWGQHDKITPVELAETFVAHTPGARLHIFEDLGHVPMEEAPAIVAAVTSEFLAALK